jgi:antitoxin CptB
MSDDATEYARLRWRCRRGLLELDVVLQRFLDQEYQCLSPEEQAAFTDLLARPDDALLGYLNGVHEPPENELKAIVKKLR